MAQAYDGHLDELCDKLARIESLLLQYKLVVFELLMHFDVFRG